MENAPPFRSPFASPLPTTSGVTMPVQTQSPVPQYPQVGAYQPYPTQAPSSIPVPGSYNVPTPTTTYSNLPMLNTPAVSGPPPVQPQTQPLPSPVPNSAVSMPASATPTTAEEKASKKQKAKTTRLVYSDSEVSLEEKMASMPRYAFNPETKQTLPSAGVTTIAV